MSEPTLSPISRGVIHPADPPRDKIAVRIKRAVEFEYAPPERRAKTDKCITVVPGLWRNSEYLTIDELDDHIAELTELSLRAKEMESAEHHDREWGEIVPER